MLRPEAFQQPFVAMRNIPYLCGVPEDRDYSEGGVLCQGQTVWTNYSTVPGPNVKAAAAFIEGVGVVALDPHWLVPAYMVRLRQEEPIDRNAPGTSTRKLQNEIVQERSSMVPEKYRHSCVVKEAVPYHVVESLFKGSLPGVGTLEVGRIVWLDGDFNGLKDKRIVRAYAEGIGFIELEPRVLRASR